MELTHARGATNHQDHRSRQEVAQIGVDNRQSNYRLPPRPDVTRWRTRKRKNFKQPPYIALSFKQMYTVVPNLNKFSILNTKVVRAIVPWQRADDVAALDIHVILNCAVKRS